MTDNKSSTEHKISEKLHQANAAIKENTGIHVQDYLAGKGKEWSSEEDRVKEKYHQVAGGVQKEIEKGKEQLQKLEKDKGTS